MFQYNVPCIRQILYCLLRPFVPNFTVEKKIQIILSSLSLGCKTILNILRNESFKRVKILFIKYTIFYD